MNKKSQPRFKRGQAVMEFLMTYGWVIIVVLTAIGALVYIGVIDKEVLTPNNCYCAYINKSFSQEINHNGKYYIECLDVTNKINYYFYECVNKTLVLLNA